MPRIRLRTSLFAENTYCWNSLIQFVYVIRRLFDKYYSSREEPFRYFSDGSVEMAFVDVLDRPVMEVLGPAERDDYNSVYVCSYDEWFSFVKEKRLRCHNGFFHEDEPSMLGLDFLQELYEFVLVCANFFLDSQPCPVARTRTSTHRGVTPESNPPKWKLTNRNLRKKIPRNMSPLKKIPRTEIGEEALES